VPLRSSNTLFANVFNFVSSSAPLVFDDMSHPSLLIDDLFLTTGYKRLFKLHIIDSDTVILITKLWKVSFSYHGMNSESFLLLCKY
jgi:hypothetical protein